MNEKTEKAIEELSEVINEMVTLNSTDDFTSLVEAMRKVKLAPSEKNIQSLKEWMSEYDMLSCDHSVGICFCREIDAMHGLMIAVGMMRPEAIQ